MRAWIVAALVLAHPGKPAYDWNAYCAGWCQARYETGYYDAGRCACVDTYPINTRRQIEAPARPAPHEEPQVYYGLDQMHVAPVEPDPPLTYSPYDDTPTY